MHQLAVPQFARVTSCTYRPETLSTALDVLTNQVITTLRSREDYGGELTLLNRDHCRLMTITLWAKAEQTLVSIDPETNHDVEILSQYWDSPLMRETYSIYVNEARSRSDIVPHTAHARFTTIRVDPQHWNSIVEAGHAAVEELEREHPGFIGVLALGDNVTGKAIFGELWESRAALRASEMTAYRQERAARSVRMLLGVPQHSTFHIEHMELGRLRSDAEIVPIADQV
ncbi:MAG: hypothetical protein M9890_00950 [Thermomicrobiales bacterium]|nr:hypothetical protein [Thermomicrobiales bacterium]